MSIWNQWSITVSPEKPPCSATLADSASVGAIRAGSDGVE
jgi:hypothetical protein